MTWLVSSVLFVAMFGLGGFVVAKVLVDRRRDRKIWSAPSLTAEEAKAIGGDLQDPSAAGTTAGSGVDVTDAWAIAQAQSRVTGNNAGMWNAGL
jgi:hypothetical protein